MITPTQAGGPGSLSALGFMSHSCLEERTMNTSMLFAKALGIVELWYVQGVEFSMEARRLDIQIDFRGVNEEVAAVRVAEPSPSSTLIVVSFC
jgi:hypothetical protein